MKRFLCLTAILLSWPAVAGAITVDGSLDAEYGAAVALQGTPTQFGNNESELNGAYAVLDSGNLSLMLTGNIQNNGNGIVLFIDSRVGGAVASLLGDNSGVIGSVGGAKTDDWGTDTDGGAGTTPGHPGSILDPGFNPDMALTFSNTNDNGGTYYMNVIDLTIPNDDNQPDKDVYHDYYNASNGQSAVHTYTRTDLDVSKGHNGTLTHALNNTNTGGVTDTDVSEAASATTGLEVVLSTEFLNNGGQPIRILPFITNGDGGYLSNQFLAAAGIGNVGNLGGLGGTGGEPLFDAREFGGDQFITIATTALNGDYNGNGKRDAADYVMWRKAVGHTQLEYDAWRSSFGTPPGSGSLAPGNVPEPTSLMLAFLTALFGVGVTRRR